jgi:hypothetical protein
MSVGMARLNYQIAPVPAGWAVTCNGIGSASYRERNAAVIDTLAVAERLRVQGNHVEVRLIELDGIGRLLEPQDAKLFSL